MSLMVKSQFPLLPGLNHLFQPCKAGAVSEYESIEQTMSPEVLELIANWIAKRVE